jgi:hypothetical protein
MDLESERGSALSNNEAGSGIRGQNKRGPRSETPTNTTALMFWVHVQSS